VATILARLEILTPPPLGLKEDQQSIFNWPITNVILWLQLFEGLSILLILLVIDNVVPGWIFNRSNSKSKDILYNVSINLLI